MKEVYSIEKNIGMNYKKDAYLFINSCLPFHQFMPTFSPKYAGFLDKSNEYQFRFQRVSFLILVSYFNKVSLLLYTSLIK